MKTVTTIILLFLVLTINVSGQNIAFTYDADGNMTSRYVVVLRSAVIEDDEAEVTETPIVELLDQKITIYPNPTKGRVTVEIIPIEWDKRNYLQLWDASGRLIKVQEAVLEQTELEIIGDPGIYLLDIHLGDNISKWKIIKQ